MPDATPTVLFQYVLVALATWRITHLFVEEDGPGDAIVRLRRRAGNGWAGQAMDCFYCLSLWVAAPLVLVVARTVLSWTVAWLAVSAAACLIERITERTKGGHGELLRRQATHASAIVDRSGAHRNRSIAGDSTADEPRLSR